MKRDSIFTWSGSAITAKVFIPIIFVVIAGIVAGPIHDLWTAAWCFLIVLPLAGSAIWMFANIGDIRPCTNGLSYRKWLRWRLIQSDQIRNIIRVFPCFAAVVPRDGGKLYFFPDPETTRHLKRLSDRGLAQTEDSPGRNQTSLLRQLLAVLTGVVIGILIRWIPQAAVVNHPKSENALLQIEHRYFPWLIGGSLIYLATLVITGRLQGRQLYFSLALIGIGAVYLSGVLLSAS
jgi:hypothetical protein